MSRHPATLHRQDIRQADHACYPGSTERRSLGSPLGQHSGFARIGIHHELLPPGRRTSWPHAEETDDEFVHVLEGTPDVWLNGVLYRLQPGGSVRFPAGRGLAHTFINNTERDVRLLRVGDRDRDDNRIHYPQHPARKALIGAHHWHDCPYTPQGGHDGRPNAQRTERKAG